MASIAELARGEKLHTQSPSHLPSLSDAPGTNNSVKRFAETWPPMPPINVPVINIIQAKLVPAWPVDLTGVWFH